MKEFYYVFLSIVCLGAVSELQAQGSPQLQWVFNAVNASPRGGNSDGKSIAVDASGNRYVTGYFQDTADFDPSAATANLTAVGTQDIFIAKYDASGNYLWAKAIGGISSDWANAITLDNSGQVHIAGFFGGTVDFDPSAATTNLTSIGGIDIFIAKYDTNGNYVWAKAIGGTSSDTVNTIALDNSGQVHIAGYFVGTADFDPSGANANLTSSGSQDVFIAKYDANGNYLWAKVMGGTNSEAVNTIALDNSGQVHIAGYFQGTSDFDPSGANANLTSLGSWDIFIAKYDTNGNYLWAKAMSGVGTETANAIVLDGSGQVHVTGYFQVTVDFDPSGATANLTSSGGQDIFIAKYDTNGNYIWAKAIGSGAGNDQANAVALDSSGQIHITGSFVGTVDFDPSVATANLISIGGSQDIYIAKYDANGDYIWAKAMGGASTEAANAIALGSSGQVYSTGAFAGTADFDPSASTTNLTSGTGTSNCFTATYTPLGNYLNALVIGGYSNQGYIEEGKAMATDSFGNVYVTGYFQDTADFDPSGATGNLTSSSGQDIFIAKYDASGNYLWAKVVGGSSNDVANAITLDSSGQVYITGYFNGTADFDPSVANANLTSIGGSQDIFIAKYDTNGNYLWAKAIGSTLDDVANSIALDSSGLVHITGFFSGTVDFDPSGATANLVSVSGTRDIFIAKYDANGNYLWAKAIGGSNDDIGNAIALDSSGRVNITGYFQGTTDFNPSGAIANLTSISGTNDIFIAKYDASGNYLWAKAIGNSGSDVAYSIALDSSGQVHITGYFNGTVDFDPSGANANLTAIGGVQDIFIAKYDTNGNYLWAKAMGGTNNDTANAIALDNSGQVHIAGYFNNTVDFDPSGAIANLTSISGSTDIFIAKYDANGNYLWAKAVGGSSVDVATAIALDSSGKLHVTGIFQRTVDFEPLNSNGNLTSLNSIDMFLAQYKECTAATPTVTISGGTITADTTADTYQWIDCTNGNAPIPSATNQSFTPAVDGNYAVIVNASGCQSTSACQAVLSMEEQAFAGVSVFPNPTTGKVTITMPLAMYEIQIVVTDMLGKVIKTTNSKEHNEISIALDDVAKGVYFIRLQSDQKTKTYKVIKQ